MTYTSYLVPLHMNDDLTLALVLCQLEPHDRAKAACVCRRWRDVERSEILHEHLFHSKWSLRSLPHHLFVKRYGGSWRRMCADALLRDLAKGQEPFPVLWWVDNSPVPPHPPPRGFCYAPQRISRVVRTEPCQGCQCGPRCEDSRACACVQASGRTEFPFNQDGRLIHPVPGLHSLDECNTGCSCGPMCRNRVVQHQQRRPWVEVFHSSGKGWGLRTLEDLAAGTFVCTYAAEVIDVEEGFRRQLIHPETGRTFMLDVVTEGEEQTYDATWVGNVGRFVNHSCEPNLMTLQVFLDDSPVPHVAFFTTQFVRAMDELTLDYRGASVVQGHHHSGQDVCVPCRCGTATCCGFLP